MHVLPPTRLSKDTGPFALNISLGLCWEVEERYLGRLRLLLIEQRTMLREIRSSLVYGEIV